jgi:hypothetical protein
MRRIIHTHLGPITPDIDGFLKQHSEIYIETYPLAEQPDLKAGQAEIDNVASVLKSAKENFLRSNIKQSQLDNITQSRRQLEKQFSENILTYVADPTPRSC